jgi:hypothetical protein
MQEAVYQGKHGFRESLVVRFGRRRPAPRWMTGHRPQNEVLTSK